jgi:hydroxymethylpyrimidine pyrophosphatase-like HAD family hydrolase
MHFFSAKLDETLRTIELVLAHDLAPLAAALTGGLLKTTVALGSGGSAISAEYLALCRGTLGAAPTLVQTPMEFVFADGSLADSEVFLFSAGGNNPDILAAQQTAVARGARALHVVTTNRTGELARTCAHLQRANLHVLPTADVKDGFLATHSLASSVTATLVASDLAANGDGTASLGRDFLAAADRVFAADSRKAMAECFASLRRTDTILLLEDPRLSTVGLLIETSVWETALCSIQRTDHRNFAHGRHVWLQRRPNDAMIISLVGPESIAIWKAIEKSIPEKVPRFCLDVRNCGRFENAVGLLRGLTIVEALGKATAIDPAKPGVGPFAGDIYDSRLLLDVTRVLPSAVRHKRAAMAKADLPDAGSLTLIENFDSLMARLRSATFRGLILDYDGTIVSASGRFDPPTKPVIEELERLLNGGMRIAIATGRGGSAGEELRDALPARFHRDILVGYYNGADMRTLDVDIRTVPLKPAAVIVEVGRWIDENSDLFVFEPKLRRSSVQITIELSGIRDVADFHRRFAARFAPNPEVRMARSAHTVDVCLSSACKTNVFRQLAATGSIPPECILCVGDSGDTLGNDYALLGTPFGLSVGEVCCRTESGWALFGAVLTGPDALLHILRALRPESAGGGFKMDVDGVLIVVPRLA